MSDIVFSMSADEKDVTKALQNLIRENAKLRTEIQKGVDEQKAAAKQEQEWAKLREKNAKDAAAQMSQLNAAAAKIRESVATPFELASKKVAELRDHLQAGRLSTEEYRKAYAAVAKELKEATRDHEAEARAAKAASEAKAEATRKAAEAEREHTAAVREATAVTDKYLTKEERVAKEIDRLNKLKEKGVLSSTAHARAIDAERKKLEEVGAGADKSGGMIDGLTGKMAGFVAGLASASTVIATIRQEYDLLIERQGKSKDANLTLANQQEALLGNLGDADPKQLFGDIAKLADKSKIKEADVTAAINEAMAARADLAIGDVLAGVETAAKVRKFAPNELAGLSAAAIDTKKQTGLDMDQSMGFLMQMLPQSRVKSLRGVAENFTPAVGGLMQQGADRQTAAALLTTISHGMGDVTGERSRTAALGFGGQLREFAPGQDLGTTIAQLQKDKVLREKFLSGATFEVAARPAIESLLGGGIQAQQFAAARTAFQEDPRKALERGIAARSSSTAIGVAEEALVAESAMNRGQLSDTAGARSAINRDAIKEMRLRAGRLGVSSSVLGVVDDLRTGGVQTAETQAQAIQSEIERLQSGRSDLTMGLQATGIGALATPFLENRNKDSETNKEQIAVLKELLAAVQAQAAEQRAKTHAGAAMGRRNNQGEGAP